MNTTDLYNQFRSDVVDTARPYLWSDSEVFRYMDEAQKMHCRLVGGIPDATTADVVEVPITAGEEYSPIHPSIMQFRRVRLKSSGNEIALRDINDSGVISDDYGLVFNAQNEHRQGPVRGMVLGEEAQKVRWVSIPTADDTALLSVYRLPVTTLSQKGQTLEVREEHHYSLLAWMKHLAYSKQDAETFDRGRRDEYGAEFRAYCEQARREQERRKHKPRQIKYGGLNGIGEMNSPNILRRGW